MESGKQRPGVTAIAVARGLGWLSIGLGLVDALSPGMLTRQLGMEGKEAVLRAYGLREIGTGIGILTAKDPAPWVWGRVAGDALDLATLATGLGNGNGRRANVAVALAAVAGVAVLDGVCAQALGSQAYGAAGRRIRDYSDRIGMPRAADAMRGAARDFQVPRDMRTPDALRPYTTHPREQPITG